VLRGSGGNGSGEGIEGGVGGAGNRWWLGRSTEVLEKSAGLGLVLHNAEQPESAVAARAI